MKAGFAPYNIKLKFICLVKLFKIISYITIHCFISQPEDDSFHSKKFGLLLGTQKIALALFRSLTNVLQLQYGESFFSIPSKKLARN